MTTRTVSVDHPETHYPTDAQSAAALRAALKEEGLKVVGDVEYSHVETTSGGPSKVRATFESEPAAKADTKPAEAKTDRTKTVGGK
jgi:FKBP-type peptidyl-prolyl cis-trans isomerase (trigger factor)